MTIDKRALPLIFAAALTACSSGETNPPPADAGPSGPPCEGTLFAGARVSTQCRHFVDAKGRVIFLHGVNARVEGIFDVTFDDGRTPLEDIPPFTAEDAARIRSMGMNALRLPINWSGLEPTEDMGFDEAYLDRVAATVELCAAAGLYVLLDFHQDAYSKEIGEDGAPLWAIIPPPTMLLEGPLTDLDDRRKSPQVLKAFATFFGDSADGTMLRARFAAAAAHVAKRFEGHPAVAGIEVFNEPVVFMDGQLDRLHDLVINAIHEADGGQLVFFEPNVTRNFTDTAGLATREPWLGTVYSPHIYTLAFSGTDQERQMMTKDTLSFSHVNARNEAKSWDTPLAITEFGYDPNGIQADNYLQWQTELTDEGLASGFFWVWKETSQGSWGLFDYDAATSAWIERDHVRSSITRIVAEAVSGWPTSMGFDRATGTFTLEFTGDPAIKAPNLIATPDPLDLGPSYEVTCDGAAVSATRDPATGVLEVPCGGAGSHKLVVKAQ